MSEFELLSDMLIPMIKTVDSIIQELRTLTKNYFQYAQANDDFVFL